MEQLLNNLNSNFNNTKLIWIYEDDIETYNKFTQYNNDNNDNFKITKENIVKDVVENDVVENDVVENDVIIKKKSNKFKNKKDNNVKDIIKNNILSPIDIIIIHSNSNLIVKDYIKNKIIECISNKNYIKIFGVKKSSEILTAITKEKWNQSISLFISFFINKNIIYKNKEYSFYKDKNYEKIIVS